MGPASPHDVARWLRAWSRGDESARLMRQALAQHSRAHRARERGGCAVPLAFDETLVPSAPAPDLVGLEEALLALAEADERKSRVVELRFFRLAKAWLLRAIKRGERDGARPLERG